MSTFRSLSAVVAAAAVALALLPGLAAADPVNAPNGLTTTVQCGDESFLIVANGFGQAGHIVGSTSNLIARSFADATGTYPIGQGAKVGLQESIRTCTFVDPRIGETITVTVTSTPRRP